MRVCSIRLGPVLEPTVRTSFTRSLFRSSDLNSSLTYSGKQRSDLRRAVPNLPDWIRISTWSSCTESDLAALIGNEAAKFFGGDIDGHVGGEIAFQEWSRGFGLPEPPTVAALDGFFATTPLPELNDYIASSLFGHQQGAVGAVEHGLDGIAGLEFG